MRRTDANRSANSAPHLRATGQERRSTPRIEIPFPALVRGVDVGAQAFEAHTVLDNLSSHGLYLRLAQQVAPGMRLFIVIRLSVAPNANHIALHGVVLRTEPRTSVFGTAIRFTHHRFIYAATHTHESLAGYGAQRDNS
jgi:PilZ domain